MGHVLWQWCWGSGILRAPALVKEGGGIAVMKPGAVHYPVNSLCFSGIPLWTVCMLCRDILALFSFCSTDPVYCVGRWQRSGYSCSPVTHPLPAVSLLVVGLCCRVV